MVSFKKQMLIEREGETSQDRGIYGCLSKLVPAAFFSGRGEAHKERSRAHTCCGEGLHARASAAKEGGCAAYIDKHEKGLKRSILGSAVE